MDPTELIPAAETIPAPWWIFEALGMLTLCLHFLLINTVVGASLLAAKRTLFGSGESEGSDLPPGPATMEVPIILALAINMGVAPLLFVQVNYGPLIYSSSVLMGVFWLSVIPALILAYYGVYLLRYHGHRRSLARLLAPSVSLLFIGIAFVYVNNMSLVNDPSRWAGWQEHMDGTMLNLSDPVIWPRLFHFLVASVAVAGLFTALRSAWRKRRGKEADPAAIKAGLRLFGLASLTQAAVGLWHLLVLPADVRDAFLGGSGHATGIFALGVVLGLAAAGFGLAGKLKLTTVSLFLTVLIMVTIRAEVRTLSLGDAFSASTLETRVQVSPMLSFFAVFLCGLGVLAWLILKAIQAPGKERSS